MQQGVILCWPRGHLLNLRIQGAPVSIIRGKRQLAAVRGYVDAVNSGDPAAIAPWITEDFAIIDSTRQTVRGKRSCLELIAILRRQTRFYGLRIDKFTYRGGNVLMRGRVESSDPRLTAPTMFRARVGNGRVAEWQSYASQPVKSLMGIVLSSDFVETGAETPVRLRRIPDTPDYAPDAAHWQRDAVLPSLHREQPL